MKKPKSVALLAGGKVSSSPLARFWLLSEMLGPVQASSYRLASRIANSLRAGHPVQDYREFDACRLIVISVPDGALTGALDQLRSAEISWPGKSLLLCSGSRGSLDLREFSLRGASVASITAIPGFQDLRYLLEGDKHAVQDSRHLVEHRDQHCVVIERDLKPLYLAALTCTGSLLFPLVMAASEALHQAGVPSALSYSILEKQLSRTLRAHARGGRRAYMAPAEFGSQLRALRAADPALAHLVEQSYKLTQQLLEQSGRNTAAANAPIFPPRRHERYARQLVATRH